eukprot:2404499-Rhodomonas_salina.2
MISFWQAEIAFFAPNQGNSVRERRAEEEKASAREPAWEVGWQMKAFRELKGKLGKGVGLLAKGILHSETPSASAGGKGGESEEEDERQASGRLRGAAGGVDSRRDADRALREEWRQYIAVGANEEKRKAHLLAVLAALDRVQEQRSESQLQVQKCFTFAMRCLALTQDVLMPGFASSREEQRILR